VVVGCAVWGIAAHPVNPRIAIVAGMKAVIHRDPTMHLSKFDGDRRPKKEL
jgi:hypothetical protein